MTSKAKSLLFFCVLLIVASQGKSDQTNPLSNTAQAETFINAFFKCVIQSRNFPQRELTSTIESLKKTLLSAWNSRSTTEAKSKATTSAFNSSLASLTKNGSSLPIKRRSVQQCLQNASLESQGIVNNAFIQDIMKKIERAQEKEGNGNTQNTAMFGALNEMKTPEISSSLQSIPDSTFQFNNPQRTEYSYVTNIPSSQLNFPQSFLPKLDSFSVNFPQSEVKYRPPSDLFSMNNDLPEYFQQSPQNNLVLGEPKTKFGGFRMPNEIFSKPFGSASNFQSPFNPSWTNEQVSGNTFTQDFGLSNNFQYPTASKPLLNQQGNSFHLPDESFPRNLNFASNFPTFSDAKTIMNPGGVFNSPSESFPWNSGVSGSIGLSYGISSNVQLNGGFQTPSDSFGFENNNFQSSYMPQQSIQSFGMNDINVLPSFSYANPTFENLLTNKLLQNEAVKKVFSRKLNRMAANKYASLIAELMSKKFNLPNSYKALNVYNNVFQNIPENSSVNEYISALVSATVELLKSYNILNAFNIDKNANLASTTISDGISSYQTEVNYDGNQNQNLAYQQSNFNPGVNMDWISNDLNSQFDFGSNLNQINSYKTSAEKKTTNIKEPFKDSLFTNLISNDNFMNFIQTLSKEKASEFCVTVTNKLEHTFGFQSNGKLTRKIQSALISSEYPLNSYLSADSISSLVSDSLDDNGKLSMELLTKNIDDASKAITSAMHHSSKEKLPNVNLDKKSNSTSENFSVPKDKTNVQSSQILEFQKNLSKALQSNEAFLNSLKKPLTIAQLQKIAYNTARAICKILDISNIKPVVEKFKQALLKVGTAEDLNIYANTIAKLAIDFLTESNKPLDLNSSHTTIANAIANAYKNSTLSDDKSNDVLDLSTDNGESIKELLLAKIKTSGKINLISKDQLKSKNIQEISKLFCQLLSQRLGKKVSTTQTESFYKYLNDILGNDNTDLSEGLAIAIAKILTSKDTTLSSDIDGILDIAVKALLESLSDLDMKTFSKNNSGDKTENKKISENSSNDSISESQKIKFVKLFETKILESEVLKLTMQKKLSQDDIIKLSKTYCELLSNEFQIKYDPDKIKAFSDSLLKVGFTSGNEKLANIIANFSESVMNPQIEDTNVEDTVDGSLKCLISSMSKALNLDLSLITSVRANKNQLNETQDASRENRIKSTQLQTERFPQDSQKLKINNSSEKDQTYTTVLSLESANKSTFEVDSLAEKDNIKTGSKEDFDTINSKKGNIEKENALTDLKKNNFSAQKTGENETNFAQMLKMNILNTKMFEDLTKIKLTKTNLFKLANIYTKQILDKFQLQIDDESTESIKTSFLNSNVKDANLAEVLADNAAMILTKGDYDFSKTDSTIDIALKCVSDSITKLLKTAEEKDYPPLTMVENKAVQNKDATPKSEITKIGDKSSPITIEDTDKSKILKTKTDIMLHDFIKSSSESMKSEIGKNNSSPLTDNEETPNKEDQSIAKETSSIKNVLPISEPNLELNLKTQFDNKNEDKQLLNKSVALIPEIGSEDTKDAKIEKLELNSQTLPPETDIKTRFKSLLNSKILSVELLNAVSKKEPSEDNMNAFITSYFKYLSEKFLVQIEMTEIKSFYNTLMDMKLDLTPKGLATAISDITTELLTSQNKLTLSNLDTSSDEVMQCFVNSLSNLLSLDFNFKQDTEQAAISKTNTNVNINHGQNTYQKTDLNFNSIQSEFLIPNTNEKNTIQPVQEDGKFPNFNIDLKTDNIETEFVIPDFNINSTNMSALESKSDQRFKTVVDTNSITREIPTELISTDMSPFNSDSSRQIGEKKKIQEMNTDSITNSNVQDEFKNMLKTKILERHILDEVVKKQLTQQDMVTLAKFYSKLLSEKLKTIVNIDFIKKFYNSFLNARISNTADSFANTFATITGDILDQKGKLELSNLDINLKSVLDIITLSISQLLNSTIDTNFSLIGVTTEKPITNIQTPVFDAETKNTDLSQIQILKAEIKKMLATKILATGVLDKVAEKQINQQNIIALTKLFCQLLTDKIQIQVNTNMIKSLYNVFKNIGNKDFASQFANVMTDIMLEKGKLNKNADSITNIIQCFILSTSQSLGLKLNIKETMSAISNIKIDEDIDEFSHYKLPLEIVQETFSSQNIKSKFANFLKIKVTSTKMLDVLLKKQVTRQDIAALVKLFYKLLSEKLQSEVDTNTVKSLYVGMLNAIINTKSNDLTNIFVKTTADYLNDQRKLTATNMKELSDITLECMLLSLSQTLSVNFNNVEIMYAASKINAQMDSKMTKGIVSGTTADPNIFQDETPDLMLSISKHDLKKEFTTQLKSKILRSKILEAIIKKQPNKQDFAAFTKLYSKLLADKLQILPNINFIKKLYSGFLNAEINSQDYASVLANTTADWLSIQDKLKPSTSDIILQESLKSALISASQSFNFDLNTNPVISTVSKINTNTSNDNPTELESDVSLSNTGTKELKSLMNGQDLKTNFFQKLKEKTTANKDFKLVMNNEITLQQMAKLSRKYCMQLNKTLQVLIDKNTVKSLFSKLSEARNNLQKDYAIIIANFTAEILQDQGKLSIQSLELTLEKAFQSLLSSLPQSSYKISNSGNIQVSTDKIFQPSIENLSIPTKPFQLPTDNDNLFTEKKETEFDTRFLDQMNIEPISSNDKIDNKITNVDLNTPIDYEIDLSILDQKPKVTVNTPTFEFDTTLDTQKRKDISFQDTSSLMDFMNLDLDMNFSEELPQIKDTGDLSLDFLTQNNKNQVSDVQNRQTVPNEDLVSKSVEATTAEETILKNERNSDSKIEEKSMLSSDDANSNKKDTSIDEAKQTDETKAVQGENSSTNTKVTTKTVKSSQDEAKELENQIKQKFATDLATTLALSEDFKLSALSGDMEDVVQALTSALEAVCGPDIAKNFYNTFNSSLKG